MPLEESKAAESARKTVCRITVIFEDKEVLTMLGETLVKRGIISGIDLKENGTGIYHHRGKIHKKPQYTLAIYLPLNHDPEIDSLIDAAIRSEISKYWDAPVIVRDKVEVNPELESFIAQSVPAQQTIRNQRRLIKALILAATLAFSGSTFWGVKNHMENERRARKEAIELARTETQEKNRQQILAKVRKLRGKLDRKIQEIGCKLDVEPNGQLKALPSDMAACGSYKELQDIIQEIENLEQEIKRGENAPRR